MSEELETADEDTLYPFSFLSDQLRKVGLPYSKPTIIEYEKKGIVKPGKNSVVRKSRVDRLYTAKEIFNTIRAIRNHAHQVPGLLERMETIKQKREERERKEAEQREKENKQARERRRKEKVDTNDN